MYPPDLCSDLAAYFLVCSVLVQPSRDRWIEGQVDRGTVDRGTGGYTGVLWGAGGCSRALQPWLQGTANSVPTILYSYHELTRS